MGGEPPPPANRGQRITSLIEKHIAGIAWISPARHRVPIRGAGVDVGSRPGALSRTLRLLVALLRSVYTAAVHDRLVASSPVARVSLPQSERQRIAPLTVAQAHVLAEAMPASRRAMVIAQAGLGLRVAELLA